MATGHGRFRRVAWFTMGNDEIIGRIDELESYRQ